MTEKSWPWSTVAGLGDGASELGEADARYMLAAYFKIQDPTLEGISKGVLNELEVTGVASPIQVDTGSGVCYGLYFNDAAVNIAISTPAIGTTGGRVVLQTNWAGTGGGALEARTRIAYKISADGVAAIPAVVQAFGTTWEISLATFTITTGGVISITDTRVFRRSTAVVNTEEIVDDAVTNSKIADDAVDTAQIADDAVNTAQIADDAVLPAKASFFNVFNSDSGIYAGEVDDTGLSVILPSGWSSSRVSIGRFRVTHNLNDSAMVVVATINGIAGDYDCQWNPQSNNYFDVTTRSAGSLTDLGFSFIAIRF